MSSTDLAAPSRKLLLTAIMIVVGLHVLTVVALAAIKTPELKIDKKETPPIEIELVTPPPPPPVEIEEIKIEEKPEPVREVKPKPKAQPVAAPKPKPTPTPKVSPKPKPVETKTPPKSTPPPAKQKVAPTKKPDTQVADDQRRLLAVQAEQAKRDALLAEKQAQADADAKAAQVKAAADAKRAQEIADAKAKAEAAAEAARKAKAAKEAEAAAASNKPQNFTATNANWASPPNFSFPDRAARRASSGETFTVVLILRVNKQGGIDSVKLSKPSGNAALDKEAQRQVNSGKFKPFTNGNGVPVVGNVTLPVSYQVP